MSKDKDFNIKLLSDEEINIIGLGFRTIGVGLSKDDIQVFVSWIDYARAAIKNGEEMPLEVVCDLKGTIVAMIAEDRLEFPPINEEQSTKQ